MESSPGLPADLVGDLSLVGIGTSNDLAVILNGLVNDLAAKKYDIICYISLQFSLFSILTSS